MDQISHLTVITPATYKDSINHPEGHGPRKRQRLCVSCIPCHKQKIRCDRKHPCNRCKEGKRTKDCVYMTGKVNGDPVTSSVFSEPSNSRVNQISALEEDILDESSVPATEEEHTAENTSISDLSTPATSVQSDGLQSRSDYSSDARAENGWYNNHVSWHPAFTRYRNGKAQTRGPTHWTPLTREFDDIGPYIFGGAQDFTETSNKLRDTKKYYRVQRSRNYPFGNESEKGPFSKEDIIAKLPPRDLADLWVENELNTFERTHRLFHIPTFRQEVNQFWQNPEAVETRWLAQFLMVLALGCPCDQRKENMLLVDTFLDGAESCLMHTPFMFKPKLETVRTLCLMAIAKQIDIVSFDDTGKVWMLMGFIIRLAMTMGLHRNPIHFNTMPPLEREVRKKIWTTIVFIDLQNSIDSGMPVLLGTQNFDCPPPDNLNDDEISANVEDSLSPHDESIYTDSTFQILLSKSFSTVFEIISFINTPSGNLDYTCVSGYDDSIRERLHELSEMFPPQSLDPTSDPHKHKTLQKHTLEIFLRRTLLSLHRPFSEGTTPLTTYPQSYWGSLEHSLALLVLQRSLYETSSPPPLTTNTLSTSLPLPSPIEWFAELFKGDFLVAAMYVGLGLRRNHFSSTSTYDPSQPDILTPASPAQTAYETLRICLDIWEQKIGISLSHFKTHLALGMMLAAIDADLGKGSVDLVAVLRQAAERTMRAVVASKAGIRIQR